MLRAVKLSNMAHLHDLIKLYFMLGLRHGTILLLLSTVDDTYAYIKKDFKMQATVRDEESVRPTGVSVVSC